jgi:lipopolysaccharide transport system permease protein
VLIKAGGSERHYWADMWRHRELLYFFVWRDLLVRYKQTALGVAWAWLRPFLTMIVFTVIFGTLAKLPSDNAPYPILVFAALLPWQFFANAVAEGGNSVVASAHMISKVYFPRALIPISAVLVGLVDLVISVILLAPIFVWYGFPATWRLCTVPIFVAFAFFAALGVAFWLAALHVKYRDVRYVIPFIVQIGLYVSPVGFSSNIVPEQWRLIYSLNPMVGVIDAFRWAILGGTSEFNWHSFGTAVLVILAMLISSAAYFRSTERSFADVI